MTQEELIEQLASCEHTSWVRWMFYLFSQCEHNPDGSLTIPSDYAATLKKKIETPHAALSEQEKQADRYEVAYILPIIEVYKGAQSESPQEQPNALSSFLYDLDRRIARVEGEIFQK